MTTSRMKVYSTLGPRIEYGKMVETDGLVEYLSGRTTLHESVIRHVVLELREALRFFNVEGRSVRIEGLGIFKPTIDLAGVISLNYRPDRSLSDDLNLRFRGAVANRQNIGKSNDELIALWNETYPDDPAA
jgi:hypothetical protein